jgi:hypothetical protein
MICFLLKTLQAVGSLEAKATGAFRRMAAKRMPNRMNKYGLKRLDILTLLLISSTLDNSNSHANKSLGEKSFKIQEGFNSFQGEDG